MEDEPATPFDGFLRSRNPAADRIELRLDREAAAAWDVVNRRRDRVLPGLRRLMERPSPFTAE